MIDFSNIDIDLDSIPKVETTNFNSLDNRYRNVLIIKSLLFSAILFTIYFLVFFMVQNNVSTTLKIFVLVLLLIQFFTGLYFSYFGFKKKKYKLRQHDIIYKTGLWWTSETAVPFVRVQHNEIVQGPVERLFGLAKLKLYTAGGHSSDLSIPGLKPETARKLKDFITKRIEEEEE